MRHRHHTMMTLKLLRAFTEQVCTAYITATPTGLILSAEQSMLDMMLASSEHQHEVIVQLQQTTVLAAQESLLIKADLKDCIDQ